MRWEAANITHSSSQRTDNELSVRKSVETVEAALARLTKAYSSAMTCIGALHKLQATFANEGPKDDFEVQSRRLASAARSIFEKTILLDPLIIKYCPTWMKVVQQSTNIEQDFRPDPPTITSSSHITTVKEVAYLSLVNYSDLLVASNKREDVSTPEHGILNQGVVRELPLVGWDIQFDQQLALASLCDASDMDGSDPVLWLKVASAARRLANQSPAESNRYRRLERHALEMGKTALPPNLPPNRLIIRALEEHQSSYLHFQDSLIDNSGMQTKLVLDLPRYSWTVLGRMLFRACNEGVNPDTREAFGSPCVEIHLSLLFLLPQRCLGLVCKFLQSTEIWRFEATCRGLSASILSARAMLERAEAAQTPHPQDGQKPLDLPTPSTQEPPSNQVQQVEQPIHTKKKGDEPARARSSKRVLSQLRTSCKRADRESKRGSVKYCLLASVLHCTSDDVTFTSVSNNDVRWDSLLKADSFTAEKRTKDALESTFTPPEGDAMDSRLGDFSLTAFVDKWNGMNSGPFDVMQRYVSHVAMHVVDVFHSDRDALALSVLLLDCFDLLARRTGAIQNRNLCSHGRIDLSPGGEIACLDFFSLNLLNAELRFKRSDGLLTGAEGYESDFNLVSVAIVELHPKVAEIESAHPSLLESGFWVGMKARLHWMTAVFYLERSRQLQSTGEARIAEDFGIEYLEQTIKCLSIPIKSPVLTVPTPHLASPRRAGLHWKTLSLPTLYAFRDDLQASSVVSIARQKFQEKLGEIEKHWQANSNPELRPEDVAGLNDVGMILLKRYNAMSGDVGSTHEELLEDFVAIYESQLSQQLSPTLRRESMESFWGSLWFLAPSGSLDIERLLDVPNLSILTILLTCLNARGETKFAVVQLLTCISFCSFDLLCKSGKFTKGNSNVSEDEFDDSISDDESVLDAEDDVAATGPQRRTRLTAGGRCDSAHDLLVVTAAHLFLHKVVYMVEHHLDDVERQDYATSSGFIGLIGSAMTFASTWYEPRGSRRVSSVTESHDLCVFRSLCSLHRILASLSSLDLNSEVAFLLGYFQVLVCQRHVLSHVVSSGNDSRAARSAKQKEVLGRTELIAAVLSELAMLLSRHPVCFGERGMTSSSLIQRAFPGDEIGSGSGPSSLSRLVEAMLYLWNVVLTDDSSISASVFGRVHAEILLLPLGAAITGLCGSALCSYPHCGEQDDGSAGERFRLADILDSDGSANDVESENIDLNTTMKLDRKIRILQPLCQAVHCIVAIVDTVDDKNSWGFVSKVTCDNDADALLPLVATRVLSSHADALLSEFGTMPTAQESLWQLSYPYGTRTIGRLIDSTLHKVYKHLYGFTIHGHWIEKEKISDDRCKAIRYPESTKAAAQLYRCIQRAYTLSRRSAPKAALECVAMAIPEEKGSTIKDAMRSFVFSKDTSEVSPKTISLLAENDRGWDRPYKTFHEHLKTLCMNWAYDDFNDDIRMVRKGIARELSQAPFPNISQAGVDSLKGPKSDDSQKISEERAIAAFQERELSKKFWAILDNISYDDPLNYVGWVRAAECVTLKAELIADRLGSSNGFVRVKDFSIPSDSQRRSTKLISFSEMQERQEHEHLQHVQGWIPFIGDDLTIYVEYQWASFASLEECAVVSSKKYDRFETESSVSLESDVCREIESMRAKGGFISWQQAWGGMFVEALRTIASRCLCMGFFILGEGSTSSTEKKVASLQSEILESLGVARYIEIMGSQGYGYPMRVLSDFKKRERAETARTCFKHAALKASCDINQITFDVLFMMGKSLEKIAKTYTSESFNTDKAGGEVVLRTYERTMADAFSVYQASLKEALSLEEEGALPDVQAGGSSHGKAEVFYRIHASRLKCLIAAYQYPEFVRGAAIEEAVRLTSRFWYHDDPVPLDDHANTDAVVWKILADTVSALAQCRLEHNFFHRSVYRHAQAMMWAPVFHDSHTGFVRGSRSTVPATKSHLIRGLNSSTACASSAEVIMSVLFEKRRPQLVSVWVTNSSSSPSPFEMINNSTRKFDSLRGKYFAAYVETLSLCKRSSVLETLLQQLISTKRDLPALYQASALVRGTLPDTSHAKENLLDNTWTFDTTGLILNLKRITNRAFARVLLDETPSLRTTDDYLKKCYTCFLRLNAAANDLEKKKTWQYNSALLPEVEALCQAYLARSDRNAQTARSSDWTQGWDKMQVLKGALALCSELFPSLASTLYRKSKLKKASSNKGDAEAVEGGKNSKRPAAEPSSIEFVVDVPQGLEVGDKFETTVRIGSQMKTLRLTVPVGIPAKLKFSLEIPGDGDNDECGSSSKRQKEE